MKVLPREKLLNLGVSNLSTEELFQVLIGSGTQKKSFISIAKQVNKLVFNQVESFKISLQSLETISGLGRVKSMQILTALELGKRISFKESTPKIIQSVNQAYQIVKFLANKRQEYLYAIYLNARYEIIYRKTIYIGKVDENFADPREIFSYAFLKNAYNIILAHNHPSGNPEPSESDIKATHQIAKAGKLVGINIIDHIIIARKQWTSLQERGVL